MPVHSCTKNGKPGWKWGGGGKCYTYTSGDTEGSKKAKAKATKQGAAAHASGYSGNSNEGNNKMFQKITAAFEGVTRFDKMKGKQFLVAPMVMMVEGVHDGSNGPLFYPAKELKASVPFWNSKPVIVYHPERNGRPISACDPDILTGRGVGVIMNTSYIDGKLKAEAWIDVERANIVDDRIMEAIDNGEMMELSTGLVTECEMVEGEWNEEEYTGILSNFHPDHLALLPDLKGACSIEDGAGFLRLNEAKDNFILDVTTLADKERKYVLADKNGVISRISRSLVEKITNEISFDDTRQRLQSILREKFPDEDYIWIEDVFDDYFVYEKAASLYKQEYEDVDGSISFVGLPVVVVKETNYVTMVKNRKDKKMAKKKKEAIVNSLIANEATLWEEDDKETLMAMELDVLGKMIPVENDDADEEAKKKKEKEAVANAAKKEAAEAEAKKKKEKEAVENKETESKTADEYIAGAPPEIQSMLRNGMDSYKEEKAKIIAFITKNERCKFTKEELEAKELTELRTLSVLAAGTEERKEELENLNNYAGQAAIVDSSDEEEEEPMEVPTINWQEEVKKKGAA